MSTVAGLPTVAELRRSPVPALRLVTGDSIAETQVSGARAGRGSVELKLPEMPTVSREHARFTFCEGQWWITNLGRNGLAVNGTMLVVGAAESMQVSSMFLLSGCRSVKGWYSGTSIDSQDTLAFSVRTGVRSMNETYPLDRVSEAYDRMMSGKARFRVVLSIGA